MNCLFLRREYGNANTFPEIGTALNDCTWKQISQIAAGGMASSYFKVGDSKRILLNGSIGAGLTLSGYLTEVFIIGINHNGAENTIDFGTFRTPTGINIALCDSKYENASTDGTKYFSIQHTTNSNSGGWKGSQIRYDVLGSTNISGGDATASTTTNPISGTLMAALPEDLRAVMKPMTIYRDNVGGTSSAASNVTATVDYLPLLARYEIYGVTTNGNIYEKDYQKQYEYYSAGNSKIKYCHNDVDEPAFWWNGSPANYASGFCKTDDDGDAGVQQVVFSFGLAPIFRV